MPQTATTLPPGELSAVHGLSQKHLDHLAGSAVSLDVIKERGYETALGRVQLQSAGFSVAQCKHYPGILIPLHGVNGAIVGHQYRPDHPREDPARGRVIKYENPAGASVRLDVPPRCRPNLGNPSIPLWITEGVKKVDSLASAGACAIGLTGVWGFKGRNEFGAVTTLADFDSIAFKERLTYMVFDSDSATNPYVGKALERLTEILKRKGAKVRVLQLPPGKDGAKTGADDYLAQGGTIEALIGMERIGAPKQSLKEKSHDNYCLEEGIICWNHHTERGVTELVPLCNFNAHVTEEITKDDGLATNKYFKISGLTGTSIPLPEIEVPSVSFASLGWVVSDWGMRAIIAAGQNCKDRLREALQMMSQDAQSRHIYTHTGWRHIGDKDVYLSQGGAIGADGLDVELEPQLSRYSLPSATDLDIAAVMKSSIDFLYLAPLNVTMPLWAAMYLAPLAEAIEPDFTLWLVGPSGTMKSTITAQALCHFGDFTFKHLPASWRDTANQLEKLLFLAKDMPLVIDDWAPGQDASKARELEVKAEHIIRAQGNLQGRGRMRTDTSSRPSYAPRGLLITSGEQLPSGHSHTARIFTVRLEPGDIDVGLLTKAQAERWRYRHALAHYIRSLQPNWMEKKLQLRHEIEDLRARILAEVAEKQIHARLPDVIALLLVGLNEGLNFAVKCGAINEQDASFFMKEGQRLFIEMACAQGALVQEERPANRFIEGLRACLNMGTAVLRNKADIEVKDPGPGRSAIGWRDSCNGHIYLDPLPAYQVVVQYYEKARSPFTLNQNAVWQDLRRLGMIECKGDGPTNVLWIQNNSRRVLSLKRSAIDIPYAESDPEDAN